MQISGWFQGIGLACCLLAFTSDATPESGIGSGMREVQVQIEASANYLNYQRSKDKQKQHITSEFRPDEAAQGWPSAKEAAFNFFLRHDQNYLDTDENTELAGFLLVSEEGRYFFTNAVTVPAVFQLKARAFAPAGWTLGDFLHSHPGGNASQRHFSEVDRQAVRSAKRSYFLRGPDGDIRFMNRKLARSTKTPEGALGESVCPQALPCLTEHPQHGSLFKVAAAP
jgi:hypothetical protein